jgi:hypothetical protein
MKTARSSASQARSPSRACRLIGSWSPAPRTLLQPRRPPRWMLAPSSRASSTTCAGRASKHERNERLESARLDPYPGVWVQGVGEYGENGQSKAIAIAIGPEFGTVGPGEWP